MWTTNTTHTPNTESTNRKRLQNGSSTCPHLDQEGNNRKEKSDAIELYTLNSCILLVNQYQMDTVAFLLLLQVIHSLWFFVKLTHNEMQIMQRNGPV